MAAYQLAAAGLRPVLIHDGMGASPWVHGFNVPVRPEDDAEAFLADTLQSGLGLSDERLARILCGGAQQIYDFLDGLALCFNKDGDRLQALKPLGSSQERVISIGNETGTAVLNRLKELLHGKVDEIPHSRALKLYTDAKGVCGALCYHSDSNRFESYYARTVVLATGGFCGIFPVSTNKRDSGGDGIAMAYEAGCKLCDLELIQFEPSAAVYPQALVGTSVITTLFFEGAVLRNADGERFMLRYSDKGECVGKDVQACLIASEIASGKGSPHGGVYMDITGVPQEVLDSKYPMYVKRYADVGMDLRREWIELAPAPHTALGGVCIDTDCRATLPGLYACGEIVGGLHGANRIGGNAGLETLVFGRRAGMAAAKYALEHRDERIDCREAELPYGKTSIEDRLTALRSQMQQLLREHLGAVRSARGLQTAKEGLASALNEGKSLIAATPAEQFARLRLLNDLSCALLVTDAALCRDHSIGCHNRSDAPRDCAATYRIIQKRGQSAPVKEPL